jgi:hypothetical protein
MPENHSPLNSGVHENDDVVFRRQWNLIAKGK